MSGTATSTTTTTTSSGLDKSRLVLARLNAATGQWEAAPKAAGDPRNNYVSATVVDLGTYVIYQR